MVLAPPRIDSTKTTSPPLPFCPLISVIIPVYQAEQYIVPTLSSVLNQTYSNFEVIIVDDGCEDQSIPLIKNFQNSKIKIFHQQNSGVAIARNYGFSQAQGEYVTFLDSDDLWFPDKLQVDVETIQNKDSKTCLIYAGFYCIDNQYNLINIPKHYQGAEDIAKEIISLNLMIPSNTLLHRAIFEETGGFPTNSYHEDRAFFIKCSQYFPAYPTPKRTVVYRQAPSGRLRKVLSNYDLAYKAELSIIESLEGVLEPDELKRSQDFQTLSLMNRFLKYNLLNSAKTHANHIPIGWLLNSKKGLLTVLTLITNINFIYIGRITLEFCLKIFLFPWWSRKRALIVFKPV